MQLKPVSYTHLDVYKRQPEVLAAGGIFMEKEPYEAVVCDNLVTSPAWPGNVEILKGFLKLLGVTAL